jgi:hypothetical protein
VEAVDELFGRAVESGVQFVRDVRREQRNDEQPGDKNRAHQGEPLAVGVETRHEWMIL